MLQGLGIDLDAPPPDYLLFPAPDRPRIVVNLYAVAPREADLELAAAEVGVSS